MEMLPPEHEQEGEDSGDSYYRKAVRKAGVQTNLVDSTTASISDKGQVEMVATGKEAPDEKEEEDMEAETADLETTMERGVPEAVPEEEEVLVFRSLRTWTYLDRQRPGNNNRKCTSYQQRPSLDNKRSRSMYFRSR